MLKQGDPVYRQEYGQGTVIFTSTVNKRSLAYAVFEGSTAVRVLDGNSDAVKKEQLSLGIT